LINTDAGERWVLKARNDRPSCRESLFYQTILRDSPFAPPYIGSATTDDGICLLVVKHLDGEVLGQSDFHAAVRTVLQFQMSVKIDQIPGEIMSEAFPDPIDYDDIRYIYETRLCEAEGRGRISRETVKILRGAAPYIAEVISQEPIMLDHGDVRPENFIMCSDGSVKMIDFENLGYRRRSTAVASMLCNWENSPKVLDQYALSIGNGDLCERGAFLRAVAASSLWLGVRDGKSESELFRLHANLLVR
jgi:serine/threonine protein kinase